EPPDPPLLVQQPCLQAWVLRLELVDDLAQRGTTGGHLHGPTGKVAQNCRDTNCDTHAISASRPGVFRLVEQPCRSRSVVPPVQSRSTARNSSREGGMVTVGRAVGSTASMVFSPSPVLRTTVSASGSSLPAASSF